MKRFFIVFFLFLQLIWVETSGKTTIRVARNGQKLGSARTIHVTWFQTANCHVLTPDVDIHRWVYPRTSLGIMNETIAQTSLISRLYATNLIFVDIWRRSVYQMNVAFIWHIYLKTDRQLTETFVILFISNLLFMRIYYYLFQMMSRIVHYELNAFNLTLRERREKEWKSF